MSVVRRVSVILLSLFLGHSVHAKMLETCTEWLNTSVCGYPKTLGRRHPYKIDGIPITIDDAVRVPKIILDIEARAVALTMRAYGLKPARIRIRNVDVLMSGGKRVLGHYVKGARRPYLELSMVEILRDPIKAEAELILAASHEATHMAQDMREKIVPYLGAYADDPTEWEANEMSLHVLKYMRPHVSTSVCYGPKSFSTLKRSLLADLLDRPDSLFAKHQDPKAATGDAGKFFARYGYL